MTFFNTTDARRARCLARPVIPSPPSAIINPTGVYHYFDKITVWLKHPLSFREVAWLTSQCGSLHVLNKRPFFETSLEQRLQLYQPTREALEWLARRDDVLLNFVEWSLDWIFDHEFDRADAWEFVCQYHVKKYHRDQGVRFVGEGGVTRYTGPRSAPNLMVVYRDRPSKVTGELYCLHFDWRMKSAETLRRAGIHSVADLLRMSHRQFWLRRLLLYRLIPDQLGRRHWNYYQRRTRRRAWIVQCGSYRYDVFRRRGSIIARHQSTQAVIDAYRRKFEVRACLKPIDVGHLLPTDITYDISPQFGFSAPNTLKTEVISQKGGLSHG